MTSDNDVRQLRNDVLNSSAAVVLEKDIQTFLNDYASEHNQVRTPQGTVEAIKAMNEELKALGFPTPEIAQSLIEVEDGIITGKTSAPALIVDKVLAEQLGESDTASILNISAADLAILKPLGLTTDQLVAAKAEFNAESVDPTELLVGLIQQPETKVLAIGEQHDKNEGRQYGATIMQKLHDAGATHLAIELDVQYQSALDKFMQSGNVADLPDSPPAMDLNYQPILLAARAAGLKIVAVDEHNAGDRDFTMSSNVENILSNDPKAKVIFWAGAGHDATFESPFAQTKSAAMILRQNLGNNAIKTVWTALRGDAGPLQVLTDDLQKPAAVATSGLDGAPNLIGLLNEQLFQTGPFGSKYRDWDYMLAFPAAATS